MGGRPARFVETPVQESFPRNGLSFCSCQNQKCIQSPGKGIFATEDREFFPGGLDLPHLENSQRKSCYLWREGGGELGGLGQVTASLACNALDFRFYLGVDD